MAVSLTSPTSATSNGTGTFYVPAWRYSAAHHQNYNSRHQDRCAATSYVPRNGSPPRSATPASIQPTAAAAAAASMSSAASSSRLPTDMPRDPRLWSRDDVHKWLRWCQEEFDLPTVDVNQFSMNGKAMCLLMKSDFNDRAPRAGDVLYNAVHLLLLQVSVNDESQRQRYEQQLRMYTQTGGSLLSSNNIDAGSLSNGLSISWPFVSNDYHNLGQVIHQTTVAAAAAAAYSGYRMGTRVEGTVTLSPAPSTDSQSSSPRRDGGTITARSSNDLHVDVDGSNGLRQRDSLSPSESGESEAGSPAPPLPVPSPVLMSLTKNKQINCAPSDVIAKSNDWTALEQPVTNGRLLWDFLHQLLNDPAQRYSRCIAWKERETGVFKIVDPHSLAQLWGMQKNHLNMNFDKMSRALRYYYRVNILKKVQGERHCYQFLRQPTELKACKQRALLKKYTCAGSSSLPSKQVDPDKDSPSVNGAPVHIKCEVIM